MDTEKKIVYWINKNEQYILDILQLDSIIAGRSLYKTPKISELVQSFFSYSLIMERNHEDIREKLRNNLSNNIKMPIYQQSKKSIAKKYNLKSLKIIPFTQSYGDEKFSDFDSSRVIALNFKKDSYKIMKTLIEDIAGENFTENIQYPMLKSIFQLFISDFSFLSTFRTHAFITYIYQIPLLDSFYFFTDINNTEKMFDLSKIKKIISEEIDKDLPLWESYKDKDPIDVFFRDTKLNSSQKFYFSRVLLAHYLIEESNFYIAQGKFPSFSYMQWILLRELLFPKYKEILKDQYEYFLDILLTIIKNFII
ncbi:MAG: hypothetical protein RXO36_05715 [Candidatus Nanopusillus acidilobi]